jgi:diacylglycerol kinase family enzyme
MTADMRFQVVLNCKAGTLLGATPEAGMSAVADAFAALDVAPRIVCVEGAAIPAAIRAAADEADVVVVGGGDGTLRSAAAVLAGHGAALAVLPLGTFNHFAKDLGIPLELGGAVHAAVTGTPGPLDIAAVNGRIFINHAAVGVYPRMVEQRERLREAQGLGKFPAMAIAMADTFRDYRTFGLRIRLGGETRTRRSPFLFVANNSYILDAYGLERHEGREKLTLLLAHDAGRWGLFRMGLKALAGRLGREAYETFIFERAVIESRRRRLLVELDGEIEALAPPLEFELMPRALRVIHAGGSDVGARPGKLEGMERPPARAVG